MIAKKIDVVLPPNYLIGRCHHGLMTNERFFGCGTSFSNSENYLDLDVALGYSLKFSKNFQHEFINGAAHAGLIVNWVSQDLQNRAIICALQNCQILGYVVPTKNLININNIKFPLRTRSINLAFPNPRTKNTLDAYPIGSFWYFDRAINYLEEGNDILFLSRNGSQSRSLSNENEVIGKLKEYAQKNKRKLVIYPHNMLVTEQQSNIFARASTVIGLHGGSFSNLVFCRKGTKVLEINNEIKPRRDCFAAISLAKGLRYVRIGMLTYHHYRNSSYNVTESNMNQIMSEII